MNNFEKTFTLNLPENISKKWALLQLSFSAWQLDNFKNTVCVIKEENGSMHDIFTNLTLEEFLEHVFILDVENISFRGKFTDCVIDFSKCEVFFKTYDEKHFLLLDDLFEKFSSISFIEDYAPGFEVSFTIKNKLTDDFCYNLISFIYYLSDTNIKKYGIKIGDRTGKFNVYYDLKFSRTALDKFIYMDDNIFISLHPNTNTIVVSNLPKNKIMELRQWCNLQLEQEK